MSFVKTCILTFSILLFFSSGLSAQKFGIVGKNVDVKEAPTKKAKIMGRINKGDKVPLLDEEDGHFKIKIAEGEGYIKYKYISKIGYYERKKADLSPYTGLYIEPIRKAYQEYDITIKELMCGTRLKCISLSEYENMSEDKKCKIVKAIPEIRYPEFFDIDPKVNFSLKLVDCNDEIVATYKKRKFANILNPDGLITGLIKKTTGFFVEDL